MTQAANINRAFELEIERIGRAQRVLMVKVTRNVYRHIMNRWPVWSGYSKANNRISITGRPISRIEPTARILRKGAHVAKAGAVESSELSKLNRLLTEKGFGKRDRVIVIGNAVDYAADLGPAGASKGRIIYEEARQMGEGTRIS